MQRSGGRRAPTAAPPDHHRAVQMDLQGRIWRIAQDKSANTYVIEFIA
jgi:hypothetical protein